MPWGAAAAIGSAAIGAGGSMAAGGKASSAAKQSAEQQMKMYMQTRADLSPYNVAGQSVLPQLTDLATGSPTGGGPDYVSMAGDKVPLQMTQEELEKTPGYQWNLAQGLKAVQSAAAARGLGVSGSALKGAATYATGLADNTYKNQFDMAQSRFNDYLQLNTAQQSNLLNQYKRLSDAATLGESAAAQTGKIGSDLSIAGGNALQAAGQYQGAGIQNAANAVSSGLNNYMQYDAYQRGLNPTTGGYMVPGASGGVYSPTPPAPISMPIIPPSA